MPLSLSLLTVLSEASITRNGSFFCFRSLPMMFPTLP